VRCCEIWSINMDGIKEECLSRFGHFLDGSMMTFQFDSFSANLEQSNSSQFITTTMMMMINKFLEIIQFKFSPTHFPSKRSQNHVAHDKRSVAA
jgi:hypothetical protein